MYHDFLSMLPFSLTLMSPLPHFFSLSLTKDMTGKEDQYRPSAIRALCAITDVSMQLCPPPSSITIFPHPSFFYSIFSPLSLLLLSVFLSSSSSPLCLLLSCLLLFLWFTLFSFSFFSLFFFLFRFLPHCVSSLSLSLSLSLRRQ